MDSWYKNVMDRLEALKQRYRTGTKPYVALVDAKELLKRLKAKEMPMKPNDINKYMYDTWKGWCGSCGGIVFNLHACCPHCGQKQDWSDVDKGGEQE